MFIIYDLIFLFICLFYLPIYLFKRKFHRGFWRRLGVLPKGISFDNPIWVHAVSVGEAQTVRNMVEQLRRVYPDKKFVFSTVTPTGNKIAKSIAKEGDFVTFLPLDFSFIIRNIINRINPWLFLIAETEIWPNLISFLNSRNIPVAVVNGRISDASFKGYRSIRFLVKAILNKITLFCVQTERDAGRLIELGVNINKIKVSGNMKFDSLLYAEGKIKDQAEKFKSMLKLTDQESVWVAGSTHAGEEEIIVRVYKQVLSKFSNLILVIAPRHPERAKDVESLVRDNGFIPVLISQLGQSNNAIPSCPAGRHNPPEAIRVYILDTIGHLMYFYSIATLVFVGGSLVRKGGHNILEPAVLAKPVIFGRYMFNFSDIVDLFLRHNAAIQVQNEKQLRDSLCNFLSNPNIMFALSQRAKALVLENKGATEKNLEYIKSVVLKGKTN